MEQEQGKQATRHKQVTIRVGDQKAEVDAGIAPLIREIWKAGIETVMSCQEDGWGVVWLEFPEEHDLREFLDIVAEYEEGLDSLYNRMTNRWTGATKPYWEFEISPWDLALREEETEGGELEESHGGEPAFAFWYDVRFPPCDLPQVLKRLRQHNRAPRHARQAIPALLADDCLGAAR